MNKSVIAAAALSALSFGAAAQSSVTVFGILDANVRYIKNGSQHMVQQGTDGLNSSRLGFRGVEDLGGGLSAGFWLESGLNPDDGGINASGKFWHRRSTVSLIDVNLGEIRLGRDFAPSYTAISDFDPFGDNGVGKFSDIQSRLGGTVNTNTRVDNQVQYFLPKNLGGVYGMVSAAPGEGALGNRFISGRAGWQGGPVNVSGAYGTTRATAAEDDYKIGVLSASYDFGVLKLMGSASQMKLLGRKELMIIAGVTVPVGPGVIRASIGSADLKGGTTATATSNDDDATLLALGYVHNLSKRTALYGTAARIKNKGVQKFAVIATPAIGAGQTSTGFELGLRHSF